MSHRTSWRPGSGGSAGRQARRPRRGYVPAAVQGEGVRLAVAVVAQADFSGWEPVRQYTVPWTIAPRINVQRPGICTQSMSLCAGARQRANRIARYIQRIARCKRNGRSAHADRHREAVFRPHPLRWLPSPVLIKAHLRHSRVPGPNGHNFGSAHPDWSRW